MFCYYTLLGIISVAFVQYSESIEENFEQTRPAVPIGSSESLRIQDGIKECREFAQVDSLTIKRILTFQAIEPKVVNKDFLYCLLTSLGYATEDGHLHQDVLKFYDNHPYKKDVKFIYDHCNNVEYKSLYIDTLFEVLQCFIIKTPIVIIDVA